MAEILKYFGTNLKISGPLQSVPLEWFSTNDGSKFLKPINKPRYNILLDIKSYIASLSILLIALQATYTANSNVLTWMILAMISTCESHQYFCRTKAVDLSNIVNELLKFNQVYPTKRKRLSEMSILQLLSTVMVPAVFLTQVVIPTGAVFGFHWINPWKPSLAGYWLIPKPDDVENEISFHVARIITLLYNFWVWAFIVQGPVVVIALVQTLWITTMLDNIETFGQFSSKSDEFDKYDRKLVYQKAIMYRHLQILTGMINNFQKNSLILVLIFAEFAICFLALTSLVRNPDSDLISLATMLITLFDCFMAVVVLLGQMANVYRKSADVLESISRNRSLGMAKKATKWEQRFYKSCPPLKIMIGSAGSFVDTFTPLNCLQESMGMSVNVLLLGE